MMKVMSLLKRLVHKNKESFIDDIDVFKHSMVYPDQMAIPLYEKDTNRLKEVTVRTNDLSNEQRSIVMKEDKKEFKLSCGDKSVDFKAKCADINDLHADKIDINKTLESSVVSELSLELSNVVHQLFELLASPEVITTTEEVIADMTQLPDIAPPAVSEEDAKSDALSTTRNRAGMVKEFFTECPELRHIPIVSKPTFLVTAASGESEAYAVKVQNFANLPIFLLYVKDKNIVGFSGMIVPESNSVHTKGECVVRLAELPKEASPDREFIVPTCKG